MSRKDKIAARLAAPHVGRKTLDLPNFGPGLVAHRLVMETAVAMAQEVFEVCASDNGFYKSITADGRLTERAARMAFIERVAPQFLQDARVTLTDCLTRPDEVVPAALKLQIHEALCLDAPLMAKRAVDEGRAVIPSHLH